MVQRDQEARTYGVIIMSANITAEEYLARVERLSKELAQHGTKRPQPKTAVPAKPTRRRGTSAV
jgi:hypothetical protein